MDYKSDQNTVSRKCIVTGEILPKNMLLRFILYDNDIYFDVDNKLAGKGIWLKNNKIYLDQAIKKNIFAKICQKKIIIAADLASNIEKQLRQKILQFLSIAKKMSIIYIGQHVIKMQKSKNFRIVFRANDSKANFAAYAPIQMSLLSSVELAEALGEKNIVHVAIKDDNLCNNFALAIERLNNFYGLNDD